MAGLNLDLTDRPGHLNEADYLAVLKERISYLAVPLRLVGGPGAAVAVDAARGCG
jgi:hypothetical protein